MNNNLPPIYFYIPKEDWPTRAMPESADTYWPHFEGNLTSGVYAWTLQTYLRLKAEGFPCELTGNLPSEGIVLAHRLSLPFHLRPSDRLLIVCLKADYERHPYAQLHVVLNIEETQTIEDSYFMPHWPQAGLIPRNPARGERFENVAFFGIEKNLAPQLQERSWQQQIEALGLHWQVIDRDRWNDFSDVDAILAVRSFDSQDYSRKPPTKLFNAWHAGVPVILGRESAYQAERKSELDYLEVTSVNDAILALKRLRDDVEFRRAMVENGLVRAASTQPAKITAQWRELITNIAVPAYQRWCKASDWERQIYFARRYLVIKDNYLQHRYAHDDKQAIDEPIGNRQKAIVSTIQLARKVKLKLGKLLNF